MSSKTDIPAALKALLDEHHAWPTVYTFKFIVKEACLEQTLNLIPAQVPTLKPSSKGTYVSVTWTVEMPSSEAVLAVYDRARAIDGLLAL